MNKMILLGAGVVLMLGILAFVYSLNAPQQASAEMNAFTQCLADQGAVIYGTRTCPVCGKQKEILGNSANIPYVECLTETAKCGELKIEKVPTWIFGDGERQVGLMELGDLSERTGCAMPAAR